MATVMVMIKNKYNKLMKDKMVMVMVMIKKQIQ